MRIVDAHVHVWELDLLDYGWLTPASGDLFRDVTVTETADTAAAAGVDALVLVQAADSIVETRRLVEIARSTAMVAGVVGWLPIGSPDRVARALDGELEGALRGVRALVHLDPNATLLVSDPVIETVRELGRRGLPFEVPDAFPRLAAAAEQLAAACPDTVVILDHLGKPGPGHDRVAWTTWMHRVARHPGTVAKLSGLASSAKSWTAEGIGPLVDVALEAFGPERLLFGSDWPILGVAPDYASVLSVTLDTLGRLSHSERASIMSGTADRVYRLPLS